MKPNLIYADKQQHDYLRAFVLIKPSRPFYEVGNDYQITQPHTDEVLANAKLVQKQTYELYKIPEMFAYLCRDLNLQTLTGILKNQSREKEWDVLVFSNNAYYNYFYKDKKVEAKVMRQEQNQQMEISL